VGNPIEIDSRLLTKNWGLNLAGLILPVVVALASIPYVVRGLGPERFGVLSIAWAVLSSVSVFDLGLGRATTKFVAECLGRGETGELPALVWTSLWSQMLLGVAGTVITAAATPVLVDRCLRISSAIGGETKSSFFILAASFPVVLAGNALRGLLEAAQRFDVVNYVKVPAAISIFLLPAVALPLGVHLPGIVCLLVLAAVGAALAYLAACLNLFPILRHDFSLDSKLLRPLLFYGGWITVSNFVNPLLRYMDRFVIGSVLSMSSVGYYTAPNEAISKASVLPGSLVATLFPAFASLDASGSRRKVEELCARSLKSLILLMGPALLLVVVFAHEILRLWLGDDFAAQSTILLQVFSVGVLFNSLAFIPFSLLQAVGRPDLTAKFHLLEFPCYAVALWILLPRVGLVGAALAWSLRLCVDAFLLFGAVFWLDHISIRAFVDSAIQRTVLAVAAFGASLTLPALVGWKLLAQLLLGSLVLLGFAIAVWNYVLDQKDKSLFFSAAEQIRAALGRDK